MTGDIKYANSLAEVLYYLQGIKQRDIQKIPLAFLKYLAENASKDYKCTFDYNKPLNEIILSDDAKGLIGLIAINYWCTTLEEKENLINQLNENKKKQEEKYNIQKIFDQRKSVLQEKNNTDSTYETAYINISNRKINDIEKTNSLSLKPYKQSFITKIFNKIKQIFKR